MWFLCKHWRRHVIFLGITFACLVPSAFGYTVKETLVMRSEWPTYANGPTLLNVSGLNQVLDLFDEAEGQKIVVRYPGGEAGQLWARQVRDWLVAYGVPRRFVQTEIGSGGADQLLLLFIDENS